MTDKSLDEKFVKGSAQHTTGILESITYGHINKEICLDLIPSASSVHKIDSTALVLQSPLRELRNAYDRSSENVDINCLWEALAFTPTAFDTTFLDSVSPLVNNKATNENKSADVMQPKEDLRNFEETASLGVLVCSRAYGLCDLALSEVGGDLSTSKRTMNYACESGDSCDVEEGNVGQDIKVIVPTPERKAVAGNLTPLKRKQGSKNQATRKRQCLDFLDSKTIYRDETNLLQNDDILKSETLLPTSDKNSYSPTYTLVKLREDVRFENGVKRTFFPPAVKNHLPDATSHLISSLKPVVESDCLWEQFAGEISFTTCSSHDIPLENMLNNVSTDLETVFDERMQPREGLSSYTWDAASADVKAGHKDVVDFNIVGCEMQEDTPEIALNTREIAVMDADLRDSQFNVNNLVLGFESSVNMSGRSLAAKKRRRSVSADKEIAGQRPLFVTPNESNGDTASTSNRCSQRLKRRSIGLLPEIGQCGGQVARVAEAPETIAVQGSKPDIVYPKETGTHSASEAIQLGFESVLPECATVLTEGQGQGSDGVDAEDDSDQTSNSSRAPNRLRRKSFELRRLPKSSKTQRSSTSWEENSPEENISADATEGSGSQKKKRGKNAKASPPPPAVEDIYLNRLWRDQMPKDASWETIPENPKYNKSTGELKYFSRCKTKRFMDFEAGPSPLRLKSRKQKARNRGWKPLTKKREAALNKLLERKLAELDREEFEMPSTNVDVVLVSGEILH